MLKSALTVVASLFAEHNNRPPKICQPIQRPTISRVNSIASYRSFIDNLKDWRDCASLLLASRGKRYAITPNIKDWAQTAYYYQNDFTDRILLQKWRELERISSSLTFDDF